jgi:transposase
MNTIELPCEEKENDLEWVWVGLDVSKDTLDACLLRVSGKSTARQFGNDAAGYTKLLRWVEHLAPEATAHATAHFCLEATGPYSQAVALFLAEAEQRVSVVDLHPKLIPVNRRVSRFAFVTRFLAVGCSNCCAA